VWTLLQGNAKKKNKVGEIVQPESQSKGKGMDGMVKSLYAWALYT
jgi:hypothetical protein